MGKLGAATAAVGFGGAGAAGSYATYHFGTSGGGSAKASTSDTAPFQQKVDANAEELKGKSGKCFEPDVSVGGGVFDEWLINGKFGNVDNLPNVTKTDEVVLDTAGEPKGCLEYIWKLGAEEDGWKESNFLFTWALSRGDKGFVIFLSADGKESKTLEFSGAAYFFEKVSGRWKTTKRLEMKDSSKKLSLDQIPNSFPKASSVIRKDLGSSMNQYWDFLDDEGKNIKADGVNEGHNTFKFTSSSGATKGADEWSDNKCDWWSHFFDDNKWNVCNVAQKVKGTWSQYVLGGTGN